ncbi:FAD-dependent oxidoreductase [Rhodobacteraceae bacterium KMM 6894]|nr:FAD-dependent oxidoreductase [Rhodobacteraceae bacterium KMM 6894]
MSAWTSEVDIIVVGCGAAGATAAYEAAAAGADTLLLEKMPFPGGLSIASAGGARVSDTPDQALEYLRTTCGGHTPDDILVAFAQGMAETPDYLGKLATLCDAELRVTPALGNYPFPGYEALSYAEIVSLPEIDGRDGYHAMTPVKNGTRLFRVLEKAAQTAGARIKMNAPVERLISDETGHVTGVSACIDGEQHRIRARKGVILTCGGFEASPDMQAQYFQGGPIKPGSFLGNTGDGIRMAQAVGADLWHMWHYHGPYGLVHPDPDYPFGLFLKAVPMWTPGRLDALADLGLEPSEPGQTRASTKSLAQLAWIVVDRTGQRFMDEYPPYPGDSGARPFDVYDFGTQGFPRKPAFMIFDENGRKMYPMGRAVHNDPRARHQWSADNQAEIDMGIFQKADTLTDLAGLMGVTSAALEKTVAQWNADCTAQHDTLFGRQPDTMVPLDTAPFYFGQVQPVVINTQGGPRRNRHQQVLNPFGEPIKGLYAAGELGSIFGHVYVSGGNLTECLVGGWTAARHALSAEQVT